MEDALLLHTQEVRGSSPRAPTIVFNNLQDNYPPETPDCDVNCDVTPPPRLTSVHPRRFLRAPETPLISREEIFSTASLLAVIRTWL